MSEVANLDDLNRAAMAAGYAMAGPGDDFDAPTLGVAFAKAAAVEAGARGARTPKLDVPAVLGKSAIAGKPLTTRLASGAHAVRDSVYGYLRFGIPA